MPVCFWHWNIEHVPTKSQLSPSSGSNGESQTRIFSSVRTFWLKSSVKQTSNLRRFPRHVFILSSSFFMAIILGSWCNVYFVNIIIIIKRWDWSPEAKRDWLFLASHLFFLDFSFISSLPLRWGRYTVSCSPYVWLTRQQMWLLYQGYYHNRASLSYVINSSC